MFYKQGVLKNIIKFTGKHLCQSLFFNKVAGDAAPTLLKKRLWRRCFLCEFCEIFKNTYLKEHPWTNASIYSDSNIYLFLQLYYLFCPNYSKISPDLKFFVYSGTLSLVYSFFSCKERAKWEFRNANETTKQTLPIRSTLLKKTKILEIIFLY